MRRIFFRMLSHKNQLSLREYDHSAALFNAIEKLGHFKRD